MAQKAIKLLEVVDYNGGRRNGLDYVRRQYDDAKSLRGGRGGLGIVASKFVVVTVVVPIVRLSQRGWVVLIQ